MSMIVEALSLLQILLVLEFYQLYIIFLYTCIERK